MRTTLRYSPSLIPAVLAIVGNLTGGAWTLLNPLYCLAFLVLLDWLAPKDTTPGKNRGNAAGTPVLMMHVVLHTACVFTMLAGVKSGILHSGFLWVAVLSTGINSGISGVIVAHELIHRKELWLRLIGIWNLLLVNYPHFYTEHIRNHHKNVGTAKDPATARLGESYYRFLIRTIPGQFLSAFRMETQRLGNLTRLNLLRHQVILGILAQLVIISGVAFSFGTLAAGAYLIQSLTAIALLEYVNYIEHYGLQRRESQPVLAEHSWQTDVRSTRFTLLELSRHSDHHIRASRPYPQLESHPEGSGLPSGYFGLFYLVLVPPLWFSTMDPRIPRSNSGIPLKPVDFIA